MDEVKFSPPPLIDFHYPSLLNSLDWHLFGELHQLRDLFFKRWPKHKDDWTGEPFHKLVQMLCTDVEELMGEVARPNIRNEAKWESIRNKALGVSLRALFLAHKANHKLFKKNWGSP